MGRQFITFKEERLDERMMEQYRGEGNVLKREDRGGKKKEGTDNKQSSQKNRKDMSYGGEREDNWR